MPEKIKLLLIDDEPIVGKRLRPALEKIGCEVHTIEDAREAVARVERETFDIVITDVRMEGVDGIKILETIMRRSPATKVIMITGYAMMSTAREAMEKGAFDFIAKPFEPGELRAIVQKAADSLGFKLQMTDAGSGND